MISAINVIRSTLGLLVQFTYIKIAVIKHRVILKGTYMRLNHVRTSKLSIEHQTTDGMVLE